VHCDDGKQLDTSCRYRVAYRLVRMLTRIGAQRFHRWDGVIGVLARRWDLVVGVLVRESCRSADMFTSLMLMLVRPPMRERRRRRRGSGRQSDDEDEDSGEERSLHEKKLALEGAQRNSATSFARSRHGGQDFVTTESTLRHATLSIPEGKRKWSVRSTSRSRVAIAARTSPTANNPSDAPLRHQHATISSQLNRQLWDDRC
jgi:hypothetical protein